MKVAVALNALDISRLGVLLSGFCYRSTPQIDVGFINSVLKDLYTRYLRSWPLYRSLMGRPGASA